jgi:hypothetical protein
MGTQEVAIEIEGGGSRLVVAETLIGNSSRRLSVNEFLVALNPNEGGMWRLFTPAGAETVPFTTEAFATLNREQRDFFTSLDTERRRSARRTPAGACRAQQR